jgi:dynein heavy chain
MVQEAFLEDIQNILSSGLVPNLYSNEDMIRIRDEMKSEYKRAGGTEDIPALMNQFFFNRIIDNLHLAYIVSSTLKDFSVACKSFPALINNASFIFYNPWPMEGLYEVGVRFMNDVTPLPEGNHEAITQVCAKFYDQTMTQSALKIKTT